MNKIFIVGNLGKDPEIKHTPSGMAVCEFSVGDTYKYKDKSNTTWHNIVVWGKFAEICVSNLSKGSMVTVMGRFYTESYEKDGQKRYISKVNADEVKFMSKKSDSSYNNNEDDYQAPQQGFSSDDIPF